MAFSQDWERENITGVSGGILPVYVEDGTDFCAACNCLIGKHMHEHYGMPYYDSLPGSLPSDTKHELVMAHAERTQKRLKVDVDNPKEYEVDDLPF